MVHHRMSLPDPEPHSPGVDGEAGEGGVNKEDRRASTGDFSVPVVTPVSPGVDSLNEGW